MTKDDIIRIAQEAGWSGIYSEWVSPIERKHLTVPVTMEQIERFAALVAAAEREACAKVCDVLSIHPEYASDVTKLAALAIRARSKNAN